MRCRQAAQWLVAHTTRLLIVIRLMFIIRTRGVILTAGEAKPGLTDGSSGGLSRSAVAG
jgi:hypothetical protein